MSLQSLLMVLISILCSRRRCNSVPSVTRLFLQGGINFGPLAQSVEQRTFNPWVVGSIPTGPTMNLGVFLRFQVESRLKI